MSENIGMGECCLSGHIHEHAKPTGRVETIGGLQVYVAEPKTGSTEKSIIFITDIFGWQFINVRLLADQYAKGGFYAYIPDFHEGDSIPLSFLNNIEPNLKDRETLTLADKTKNAVVVPATLGPWTIKHRDAVARPLIDGFVNTVRMVPGTDKIGCIGFCWGGRYAILQAHGQKKDETGSSIGGVDAAYACHPALLSMPADVEGVTKPLSIAFGEKDSLVDADTRKSFMDILGKKAEVPHEIRIYEDQVHAFSLRGDWTSEADKKAMDEAMQQGIEWFGKYLT